MKIINSKAGFVLLASLLAVVVWAFWPYQPSLTDETTMPQPLRFLWLQTAYDPVLALPGINPDGFRDAVTALKESQEHYLVYYTAEEREIIRSTLHPFAFLKSLPELEESRRAFLARPSFARALTYHYDLWSSLRLLRSYSRDLSDTLLAFSGDYYLMTPAGTASIDHLARVVADAYLEAGVREDEVRRRVRCALPFADPANCSVSIPRMDESFSESSYDAAEVLPYADALQTYLLARPETPPKDLALVHLPDASCTTSASATYLLLWNTAQTSRQLALFVTPVNEILFHNIAERRTPFDAALFGAGVNYAYQAMNPYFCFDYSLDAGAIRTAYAVREALQTPLLRTYGDSSVSDQVRSLAVLEDAIVGNTEVIDAGEVETYVEGAYGLLFASSGDNQGLPDADRMRLLEIVTMWRAQSPQLETEISTMDDMGRTAEYVLQVMDLAIEPLFSTRSFHSTMLLSGNRTLYREPLRFTEVRVHELADMGVVPYRGVLDRLVPLDELPAFMVKEGEQSAPVYTIE